MKKYLLLFLSLISLTGCTNIKNADYNTIINTSLQSTISPQNEYRAGYTYYLPKGLRIIKNEGNNEIFAHENNLYYLYVDKVSYYNKVTADYVEKTDVEFSKKLQTENQFGYVEIKKTAKEQYFIEIMYNYAKIEVIVPKEQINNALSYSLGILSSIKYQDTVLQSIMEENVLNSSEVEYNIFETAKTESGYLQIAEEYGQYQEEENVDPDFIRR